MPNKSVTKPLTTSVKDKRHVVRRRVSKVEKHFVQVQFEQGWRRDEPS